MDKVNVLIMAGDSGKREYDNQITNKSLIDVSGKWMVEYVSRCPKGFGYDCQDSHCWTCRNPKIQAGG